MRRILTLLLACTLSLGAIPTAGADQSLEDTSCAPPCGWINPQLYLDIPDNVPCGRSGTLGSTEVDPEGCMALPEQGEPLVLEGQFRLTWETSEEGTYLNDPNDPVVVDFLPTANNPSFIDFAVEPSSFELGSDTLFNPTYYKTKEGNDGSSSVWYEYTAPVTMTFTRSGEPTQEDLEDIQDRDGLVRVLVRIHSDSSGSTFRDSYGLEAFNFHIASGEQVDPAFEDVELSSEAKEAPLPSAALLLGAVAAAAAVARRRQD